MVQVRPQKRRPSGQWAGQGFHLFETTKWAQEVVQSLTSGKGRPCDVLESWGQKVICDPGFPWLLLFSTGSGDILPPPSTLEDCDTVPIRKPAPKQSPDPGSPVPRRRCVWLRGRGWTASHQGSPHAQKGEGCCAPLALLPQSLLPKITLQFRQRTRQDRMQTAWAQSCATLDPQSQQRGRLMLCGRGAGSRGVRKELRRLEEFLCRAGLELAGAGEGMSCVMLLRCCCRIIRTKVQQPFHPTPDGAGTGVTAPGHTIGKRAQGSGEAGPHLGDLGNSAPAPGNAHHPPL